MIRRLVVLLAVALVALAFWQSSPASAERRPAQYPGPSKVYLPIVFQGGVSLLPTSTPIPTPTWTPLPTLTPAPTSTPAGTCGTSADDRFGLSWDQSYDQPVTLLQSWRVYFSVQVFGTDPSILFQILDSNSTVVYQANGPPEVFASFIAPYTDNFTMRVTNTSLFTTQTEDLEWEICTAPNIGP